jgi:hypothetical protein
VVATLVTLVTFSVSFVPGQRVGMMKKGRVVKKTMKHVTCKGKTWLSDDLKIGEMTCLKGFYNCSLHDGQ